LHFGLLFLLWSYRYSEKNTFVIFARLGKAQVNLALLSLFAKIRPLRGNKTMPSAEKAEWHS
jgi:hypothetical protein